jgi:hypothetical protein
MGDETSIGCILLDMGALDEQQLAEVVDQQENASVDVMLGHLLVSSEICTREQVDVALQAQQGMRSSRTTDQALAVADIAAHRKKTTNGAGERVMIKAEAVTG